jgi:hypothetical protein
MSGRMKPAAPKRNARASKAVDRNVPSRRRKGVVRATHSKPHPGLTEAKAIGRLALQERLRQIRAEIAALRRERVAVKGQEFVEMTKSLRRLEKNTEDIAMQFTRTAQIQADLDRVIRALKQAQLLD